jgi:hypothetical protein
MTKQYSGKLYEYKVTINNGVTLWQFGNKNELELRNENEKTNEKIESEL